MLRIKANLYHSNYLNITVWLVPCPSVLWGREIETEKKWDLGPRDLML